MKRTILLLAFFVFAFFGLHAQGILFGGNVGFESSKSELTVKNGTSTTIDGPTNSSFQFSPFGGVFLNENFAVGLGFGYESDVTKQKDIMDVDEYKLSSSMFSVFPFVRCYYRPLEKAGLFVEGNVEVGFGKEKEELTDGSETESLETKMSGMSVGVYPGVYVNITEHVVLEAMFGGLQYASFGTKQDVEDVSTEYKGSAFSFEINPSFFVFGVSVEIGD